jgi:hypothetical protein
LGNINSSYFAKIDRIKGKVEKDLKEYPVLLIKEPFKNGKYKVSLVRANNLLKTNLDKKDEEEIVYLLIASAVSHAKKGKRFEKYGRFLGAEKLLKMHFKKIEDEGLKGKINKLKSKIEKGIIKYQIKEE